MLTADDLKRIILDALAAGDTFDAFRTRLRQSLKEADRASASESARMAKIREAIREIAPDAVAETISREAV